MKKVIISIISIVSIFSSITTNAADVPRESVALHISEECVIVAESLIADVLTEVENGL